MCKILLKSYSTSFLSSVFFFLVLFCSPLLSLHASAEEKIVTIIELIEHADEFEGKEIIVEAEVIGDIMKRGSFTWINVLDETSSIGVWANNDKINQIGMTGHYKQKGDIVKITGIFHDACLEHGGEADIHCLDMQVLQAGYKTKDSLSIHKLIITIFLILVAGILGYTYYRRYHGIRYYNED